LARQTVVSRPSIVACQRIVSVQQDDVGGAGELRLKGDRVGIAVHDFDLAGGSRAAHGGRRVRRGGENNCIERVEIPRRE